MNGGEISLCFSGDRSVHNKTTATLCNRGLREAKSLNGSCGWSLLSTCWVVPADQSWEPWVRRSWRHRCLCCTCFVHEKRIWISWAVNMSNLTSAPWLEWPLKASKPYNLELLFADHLFLSLLLPLRKYLHIFFSCLRFYQKYSCLLCVGLLYLGVLFVLLFFGFPQQYNILKDKNTENPYGCKWEHNEHWFPFLDLLICLSITDCLWKDCKPTVLSIEIVTHNLII